MYMGYIIHMQRWATRVCIIRRYMYLCMELSSGVVALLCLVSLTEFTCVHASICVHTIYMTMYVDTRHVQCT